MWRKGWDWEVHFRRLTVSVAVEVEPGKIGAGAGCRSSSTGVGTDVVLDAGFLSAAAALAITIATAFQSFSIKAPSSRSRFVPRTPPSPGVPMGIRGVGSERGRKGAEPADVSILLGYVPPTE